MFGIGFGEMVVIGVLILIAVGPDKLPVMVKTVAKTYRQFRRAAIDIRASTGIDDFLRDEELKELADLRKQKLFAMSKPGVVPPGKPMAKPGIVEKPIPGKPLVGTIGEGAPIAATKDDRGSPTYRQRTAEMPPEGVDIAEASRVVIPETRAGEAVPSKVAG